MVEEVIVRLRSLGLFAVLALAFVSCGGGVPESSGTDEIGVRGAWTIDVYNTDGSLDEHVQFHNRFIGEEAIADLLSLADTVSDWRLSAFPDPTAGNICDSANGDCQFGATASRDTSTNELLVEGSFTPDHDADVRYVDAVIVTSVRGNRVFSQKDLVAEGPGLVTVNAGQTVQVEVRYSFGTLP